MRPYGLPRFHAFGPSMDRADAMERGAPSKYGKVASRLRQAARRLWARKARAAAKAQLRAEAGKVTR
jgi:hypothetical protein